MRGYSYEKRPYERLLLSVFTWVDDVCYSRTFLIPDTLSVRSYPLSTGLQHNVTIIHMGNNFSFIFVFCS